MFKEKGTIADLIGGRFGQKGLERRAANLRVAVETVSRGSNALTVSLRPVNGALDEIDQLLDGRQSSALHETEEGAHADRRRAR